MQQDGLGLGGPEELYSKGEERALIGRQARQVRFQRSRKRGSEESARGPKPEFEPPHDNMNMRRIPPRSHDGERGRRAARRSGSQQPPWPREERADQGCALKIEGSFWLLRDQV